MSLLQNPIEAFEPSRVTPKLLAQIQDDRGAIANRTKGSIRYGIDRGVWSTPTFLVNGSPVPQLESSASVEDWQNFLASRHQ